MFGVRIALFVCTLIGVTALLPLGSAEARTHDAYKGSSYSKISAVGLCEVLHAASRAEIHRASRHPQIDRT